MLSKLPKICESFARVSDAELQGPFTEDEKFIEDVSEGTRVNTQGYIEMPLLFKNPSLPMLNSCATTHQRTQNTLFCLKTL